MCANLGRVSALTEIQGLVTEILFSATRGHPNCCQLVRNSSRTSASLEINCWEKEMYLEEIEGIDI